MSRDPKIISQIPERFLGVFIAIFCVASLYFEDLLICTPRLGISCEISKADQPVIYWFVLSVLILISVAVIKRSFHDPAKKYKRD